MARTITITSGKGGVGKTNLTANLAIQLAAMQHRCCIFDADLGLANINIVLGLYPEKTIEDTIRHNIPLDEILIKNHHGIDIIPGSSGVEKIANLDSDNLDRLIGSFAALDAYDFLFFDTSAGVSKNVISFCLASDEVILIITPEPTSMTDAYALLKILCMNGLTRPVKIVVNQCKDTSAAKQTYGRFKDVVKKYLSIEIQALGVILTDTNIANAVKLQQPFVLQFPQTIASKCVRNLTSHLLEGAGPDHEALSVESFWKRFISTFQSRIILEPGKPQNRHADTPAAQAPALPKAVQAEEPAAVTAPTAESAAAPQPAASPALVHGGPDTLDEVPAGQRDTVPAAASGPEQLHNHRDAAAQAPVISDGIAGILADISTSMASISSELKSIREALELNGSSAVAGQTAIGTHQSDSRKGLIVLDYESFWQSSQRK